MAGAAVVALWPAVAQAEPEPPSPTPARENGVWLFAGATVPTGKNGEIAFQYGELGGIDVRFAGAEGRRRVGGGFAFNAAYFAGTVFRRGRSDLPVHLVRLGTSWTGGDPAGVEIDGRLWGEWNLPARGKDFQVLRPRARVSVALPVAAALKPRLFVADELFFRHDDGFDRNRLSAGLRTSSLGGALDADVYYQRTDYERGDDIDTLVFQLTWVVGGR